MADWLYPNSQWHEKIKELDDVPRKILSNNDLNKIPKNFKDIQAEKIQEVNNLCKYDCNWTSNFEEIVYNNDFEKDKLEYIDENTLLYIQKGYYKKLNTFMLNIKIFLVFNLFSLWIILLFLFYYYNERYLVKLFCTVAIMPIIIILFWYIFINWIVVWILFNWAFSFFYIVYSIIIILVLLQLLLDWRSKMIFLHALWALTLAVLAFFSDFFWRS